jgi:hypothetical protein
MGRFDDVESAELWDAFSQNVLRRRGGKIHGQEKRRDLGSIFWISLQRSNTKVYDRLGIQHHH